MGAGMITFLAIDPGTHQMGVALFEGTKLVDHWLLTAKGEVEDRIADLIVQLDAIAVENNRIQAVACERITDIPNRPAPELATMVRRIKRWATQRPHKFAWHHYHPSTVVAAVRPRALAGKDTKAIMRFGVGMLYPETKPVPFAPVIDQNVIDAIAVGHCHLSKTIEAELVG